MSNVGELFGNHTRAPHTQELPLALPRLRLHGGDHRPLRDRPVRRPPATGRCCCSSPPARRPPPSPRWPFLLIQEHVFAYLLGGLVDGSLILGRAVALRPGRKDRRPATDQWPTPPARHRRTAHPEHDLRGDGARHRRPPAAEVEGQTPPARSPTSSAPSRPTSCCSCGSACAPYEWLSFPAPLQPSRPARARTLPIAQAPRLALLAEARPAADGEALLDARLRGPRPRSRRRSATTCAASSPTGPGRSRRGRSATSSRAATARNATSS